MPRLMTALLPLLLAPLLLAPSEPAITIAETGERYDRLQDAVNAIGEGRGTIVFASGTHRQCAVQWLGHVTFRAEEAGRAILDGQICEWKGGLVLRSPGGAAVDGLVFQNMRTEDLNGAGIRLEGGDLAVTNSLFRNSQQGILTANDPAHSLTIDRSTFSGLGRCGDHPCAHGLYVNDYGRLTVTRTRFERGTGGHYLKSRAARVDIRDNMFDDTQGSETNYMIDLSIGAVGRIANNYFVQGASKENWSAFITVGPEGQYNPSAGLEITDNRALIAPGINRQTAFIADWTGERLVMARNNLGPGLRAYERR